MMETIIRKCPDCGTNLTEIQLFGTDYLTGKPRRMLKCPKCGWQTCI